MLQVITVNHRSALRVIQAFLTVSYEAVYVSQSMMVIQLVAEERVQIQKLRFGNSSSLPGGGHSDDRAMAMIVGYFYDGSVDQYFISDV